MKTARCAFTSGRNGFLLSLILPMSFIFAAPPVLRWDPSAAGNVWNTTATNWVDASDNAVAWIPGAEAEFASASGGFVQIDDDVSATNLTFTGNGYTLLGKGRLKVEGALSAAWATTNCIVADLSTAEGLSKTGDGALALARCAGPVGVQAGSLLVAGSLFSDADLSVAGGAALVALGEPDETSNLILNPGFESPVISAWGYVGYGVVISNWSVTALPTHVGLQNAALNSTWNAIGSAPEGSQMLILQYDGAIAQTVTVPADGLYCIAFSHILRSSNLENMVYVTIDGIPFAAFLNRSIQFHPGRFVSGAFWLTAGSHTLGLGGEGGWNDRSSMIDAVCLAPPSAANACRALTGDSVLNAAGGAAVRLECTGTITNAYVGIDGAAASGTFDASHASGIFSGTGSLVCSTPGDVFTWSGAGTWSETARWLDGAAPAAGGGQNQLLRFPFADGGAATNDLAGEFLTRRLWVSGLDAGGTATLAGNAVVFTNTSPKLTQQSPGSLTVTAPVSARTSLTLETLGDVIFQDHPLGVASNGMFYKSGPGTLTTPAFTERVAGAVVYEGTVQTPLLPSSLSVSLFSQTGKSAALRLTQGDVTLSNPVYLYGSGTTLLETDCGGGTVTLSNWIFGYGGSAVFNVGAGDTLSLRQMLLVSNSRGVSSTALTKTGPGTLEIRSAGSDTGNNRAYRGATVLRGGTLKLSEDDWGTLSGWTNPFNSRTYTGTGGSLGYTSLTNAVAVGDDGTDASDDLALIASGNGRWIGHDIEVLNKGHTVTLGMTAGTAMFAGTVMLHRDVTVSGPDDGVLVFSNIVAAADYSGTGAPALSGLAGLVIEGAFPSAGSLLMDGRALHFGTYAVRAQTLNALSLGTPTVSATFDVDFEAGANDTVAVTMNNGLVLSNTVVNLYYAGTGLPFAEPGAYTLFTYAGTLGGDVSLLSVGNPQSGVSYAFSNDTANTRVTLVIGNTSGGASATWKNTSGGDWATGSNWDSGSAPSGTGVVPLFGLAATEPAAVALGTAYTVGGLTFNNAAYGYTLSGGSLTFDAGGAAPVITLNAGSHVLNTALSSPDGLSISAVNGSTLVFGTNAAVNADLTLAAGTIELLGQAAISGSTTLTGSSRLLIAAANAAAESLSGDEDAELVFSDSASQLTVSQTAAGAFAGTLSGSGGTLVKTGAATLTLDNPNTSFAGETAIETGGLLLRNTSFAGSMSLGASGALTVQTAATNGLTGYYYSVTPNTNNFWTLDGMENHFATLTPDFAVLSGQTGANFDFGSDGALFPLPYGSGGSRTSSFEAVYRGVLTVPESGSYTFGVYCNDCVIFAIDGVTLFARNFCISSWTDTAIRLDAGRHDIVIGYQQLSDAYGLEVRVKPPSATDAFMLPNAWLAPYSSVGILSGDGGVSLAASNAVLRVMPGTPADFFGGVSGAPGSLFAKSGGGVFAFNQGGADAFAGDVDVQAGILTVSASDCLSDTSSVRVRTGASFAVTGSETIGGLAGDGALAIGGYTYVAPFTDDADSGISSDKTYTHTLDFPSGTADAVINGVTFYSSAMTGSRDGYSWSTSGIVPTGAMNQSPYDYSYSGITALLWDFAYGSTNFTVTLSGLTPDKIYDVRFYFRNWNSNLRYLTFAYTAGATVVGSIDHNPDSVTRSIVGCRYRTDSSGTVSINIVSHRSSDTCHLYAMSNEEITDAPSAALTLAPAAGQNSRFTGAVTGSGALIKTGEGTQTFSGANTLPEPLDVQQGTLALESGASVTAGVNVAAGALLDASYGGVTLGGLTGAGTLSLGAYPTNTGPYFVSFTNDAGTGVSPFKTYTHLIDFGSGVNKAVVNGMAFNKISATSGLILGYGWTNAPSTINSGGNAANIATPPDQGIYNLIYDMNYGTSTGTLYLTGLTVGKHYEVRLYHRCWDAGKNRTTTLIFDPDGPGPISDAVTFNPDAVTKNDDYLGYRYVAETNALGITIQSHTADRYHLYGLSNEKGFDSVGNPATLDIAGNDVFDGVITGQAGLAKAGPGSFAVTGASTATGPVSINAGAFGPATGGTATLGPVSVAAGATLFGHGLVGGDVSVVSNAWLMAGTSSACGTLQIGGALTLDSGAQPMFRFGGGAADAFTVGGVLTFPANGVLQAAALVTGAKPPVKTALFTSALPIEGPADLTGWTVDGVENCTLSYNDDRTIIYLLNPSGTIILIK